MFKHKENGLSSEERDKTMVAKANGREHKISFSLRRVKTPKPYVKQESEV